MTAHAADDGPGVAGGQPGDVVPREHAVNPLQGLIQERLRERGWSYGEVARRGGLPRSTVYTLATTRNLVRPPRPATIDALARGLEVPVSAVRAAAAESTGLHYYDEAGGGEAGEETEDARRRVVSDRERDLLIASIDELSPEDRQHVAALVESLRSRAARGQPGGLALVQSVASGTAVPGGARTPARTASGPCHSYLSRWRCMQVRSYHVRYARFSELVRILGEQLRLA